MNLIKYKLYMAYCDFILNLSLSVLHNQWRYFYDISWLHNDLAPVSVVSYLSPNTFKYLFVYPSKPNKFQRFLSPKIL